MSSAPVRLAASPTSWGVDFADAPENPPWHRVLDEVAAAGYGVTELGPVGFLPEDPETLREALELRGLEVAGSFVFQPLHDPQSRDQVLDVTRRTADAIAAVDGRYLVVIDEVSPARVVTAGRRDAAPRLEGPRMQRFVDTIRRVGEIALTSGLRPVIHNHAGTYLEFADEIDTVLECLGEDALGVCLDTGHAAYAGMDPMTFFVERRQRVDYLHFKDVDGGVLARARSVPLDFWAAISAGVFCPLGRGIVDFEALARAFEEHGFRGWATIEQDRDADAGEPLKDAIASREYLESIGMAERKEAEHGHHSAGS